MACGRGAVPAEAGAFFAATSVFMLAGALARLGTPTGLVYWVARLHKNGRDAAIGSVLRLGLWPAAVASFAAAAVLLVTAPLFASPDLVRLLAVFIPASVAMEALLAATRGYRLMGPSVVIDKLGRTVAQLVGLGAIALAGTATAQWITFAWVLPYLPAALAAGWYLLRRHRRAAVDRAFPDRVSGRAFWGSRRRVRRRASRNWACSASTSSWSRRSRGSARPRCTRWRRGS
nr:hypothetical protein GCM10025732_54330 [Glycomyces mayteni]